MRTTPTNPVTELPLADFLEELKIPGRDAMAKYRDWVDYYDHHVDRLRGSANEPADLQDTARALVFGNAPIIDDLMEEAQAKLAARSADTEGVLERLNSAAGMISDRYERFAMTDMDSGVREKGMVEACLRMGDVAKMSYLLGTEESQRISLDASEWQMARLPRRSAIQDELFMMSKQVHKAYNGLHNAGGVNLGYDSPYAVKQYRHPAHVFDRMRQLLENADLAAPPGSNELIPRTNAFKAQ